MLILSFVLFLISVLAMLWMVIRAFPRLAHITITHHRHFSLFGIEGVHILEYKVPADVFRKKSFLFLEKTFRRTRALVLKLDNALSGGIEWVQRKQQDLVISHATEQHDQHAHTVNVESLAAHTSPREEMRTSAEPNVLQIESQTQKAPQQKEEMLPASLVVNLKTHKKRAPIRRERSPMIEIRRGNATLKK